jgi:hypothetical protein
MVVEKTCANSLRVPFVDRVLPDARYIFVVRNGLDAVASATERWRAGINLSYTLRKARFLPWTDALHYATQFMRNRLFRAMSSDRRLAQWGPRLENMDALLRRYTLEEVCAFQWRECVCRSEEALQGFPDERVLRIRYEHVVTEPAAFLTRVAAFLQISDWSPAKDEYSWVSDRRVRGERRAVSAEARERIEVILGEVGRRYDRQAAEASCEADGRANRVTRHWAVE